MSKPSTGSTGDSSSTVEQAKGQVGEMAGEAQTKVRAAVEDQLDQRSDQASEQIESVADNVRAVGDTLRERNQDMAAQIADRAAEYAQQLSDYLRESSADQIMRDVEGYARRQPWAVIAAGVMVGFAASRVLRASAPSEGSSGSNWSTATAGSSPTYTSGLTPSTSTMPPYTSTTSPTYTSTTSPSVGTVGDPSRLSGLGTTSAGSLAPSGSTYTAPSTTSSQGVSGVDR